jgi:hypothetical protein
MQDAEWLVISTRAKIGKDGSEFFRLHGEQEIDVGDSLWQ